MCGTVRKQNHMVGFLEVRMDHIPSLGAPGQGQCIPRVSRSSEFQCIPCNVVSLMALAVEGRKAQSRGKAASLPAWFLSPPLLPQRLRSPRHPAGEAVGLQKEAFGPSRNLSCQPRPGSVRPGKERQGQLQPLGWEGHRVAR